MLEIIRSGKKGSVLIYLNHVTHVTHNQINNHFVVYMTGGGHIEFRLTMTDWNNAYTVAISQSKSGQIHQINELP